MTHDELRDEYFQWMYQLVCDKKRNYQKLLSHLYDTEFTFIIEMDGNRAEDGVDLRYRFAYEREYGGAVVLAALDNRPCSVLEMMVALSTRCEENIMINHNIGNRTGVWFWSMVLSLGLETLTDEHFDPKLTDDIIQRFLNREYSRDGRGGLFTIKRCQHDLRDVEIWYQMCWCLESVS